MSATRGSLLQLIAKGDIDKYLYEDLKNVDVKQSMFKSSIKKITNYSDCNISLYPENSPSWGDTVTFKISKYGDLLTNLYLSFELPELSVEDIDGMSESIATSNFRIKWQDYIGNLAIEKVTLRIGGQKIDEQTGEFIQFHTDLYDTTWSKLCMIGHEKNLIFPSTKIDKQYIYVPLKFFFCNNPEKALPIYALNYHNVEIEVKLRRWDDLYFVLTTLTDNVSVSESKTSKIFYSHTDKTIQKKNLTGLRLDCNYIFLDDEERNYFINNKHEMLIQQVQYQEHSCLSNQKVFLNFNNPIKELIYVFQSDDIYNTGEIFNYSGKPQYFPDGTHEHPITGRPEFTEMLWLQIPHKHILDKASMQFNGNDRVSEKDYKYWHLVQNYESYRNKLEHNIYTFNFGLDKRENTGSCNFSELDEVTLTIKLSDRTNEIYHRDGSTTSIGPGTTNKIKVYGVNYNIFKIDSGMGSVMYPY
jgi:hypothetical protein